MIRCIIKNFPNTRHLKLYTPFKGENVLSKEEQAVFSLFMARLVVVFLTAITHNERDFLGSDVGRIHLGSLNSILSSPGGQFWQDEQGGNAFLDNRVRDILQSNAEYQDSLTLGSDD